MKQKLFISYSRHQTPFVDRLAGQLDKLGYQLWLDYRSLVPAKPWRQQIEAGIADTDAVLVIISKASVISQNVVEEWQYALEQKKRVVLLIFEACALPPGLQTCEWIDFRGNYKISIKRLQSVLENPPSVAVTPPPQKGFKAPNMFWLALTLSIVAIIGSIPTWWTILIPYVLIPLPWKIYKRNYNFPQTVVTLFFMPIILAFTASMFLKDGNILYGLRGIASGWGIPAGLASWILLGILLSPVMQRRAVPDAARVHFANPLKVHIKKPRSVTFTIDYAPEDGRYKNDLQRVLQRYGHHLAGPNEKPEAVFVLISTYKKSTEYDPDQIAVYPLILQATDEIAPNLQRIQWIDFRSGSRHINKLAELLPEPEQLLKALAIAPTGTQKIYPMSIDVLRYFYLLTGIIGAGGFLISLLSLGYIVSGGRVDFDDIKIGILGAVINSALLICSVFISVRSLQSRRGNTATAYPLLVLTVFQAETYLINYMFLTMASNPGDINGLLLINTAIAGENLILYTLPVELLAAFLIVFIRGKEFLRWLPLYQNAKANFLEKILLLYSPSHKRALIFQIPFHIVILIIYFALVSLITTTSSQYEIICITSLIITAAGLYFPARHLSK